MADLELNELLRISGQACDNAHAPYSGFHVGAAALFNESPKIYTGVNVENSSYGLTICAERVAIFSGIADGNATLRAIAVSCCHRYNGARLPVMPCGACRQVIAEFATPDTLIVVEGAGPFTLSELLPKRFEL